MAATTMLVHEEKAKLDTNGGHLPPMSEISVSAEQQQEQTRQQSQQQTAQVVESRASATSAPKMTAAGATPDKKSFFLWRWLTSPCLVTALVAIVAYIDDTALHGTYVYDDAGSVLKNVVVIGHVPVREVWTRDFWGVPMTTNESHKSFRPITTLTLWANYQFANKYDKLLVGDRKDERSLNYPAAFSFRVFNVLLHGAVTGLITKAAGYILSSIGAYYASGGATGNASTMLLVQQLLVGFWFGLHPVHAEVVSNITSRGELLMSLFSLLAFISYASSVRRYVADVIANAHGENRNVERQVSTFGYLVGVYVIPWAGMTLSLFSKEQGATTLVSLVIWDVVHQFGSAKGVWRALNAKSGSVDRKLAWSLARRTVALAVQTVAIAYWRYTMNGKTKPDFIEAQNPAGFASDPLTRRLSVSWVYCLYILDIVYPVYLCPDWSGLSIDLVKDIYDPRALLVICLWYGIAQSAYRVVMGEDEADDQQKNKDVSVLSSSATPRTWQSQIHMCLWAFSVTPFILSSNLLVVIGLMKADRVIYMPLFGFCLIWAIIVSNMLLRGVTSLPPAIANARDMRWWCTYFGLMLQIFFYCALTHRRNMAWSDSLLLWGHAYAINPRSHHTMYNYGYELSLKRRYEEAVDVLAPIGNPRVDGPSNTFVYAMVLFNLRRCEEANRLIDDAMAVVAENRAEGGPRNTESSLRRTESNLLVARAHCAGTAADRGRILYESVQKDPSNDYAVQMASEMAQRLEMQKKFGININ